MKQSFNVLIWNFNSDSLEYYDVMPYLRDCYKELVKRHKKYVKRKNYDPNNEYYKVPETLNDFKNFVEQESMYQYWARCEYEMICHGWPAQKNDYKLDVHEQIMMNIDIVAEILFNEIKKVK
jgi:hypothetical protein